MRISIAMVWWVFQAEDEDVFREGRWLTPEGFGSVVLAFQLKRQEI